MNSGRLSAKWLVRSTLALALAASGCAADDSGGEATSSTPSGLSVGGCACPTSGGCSSLSYSDVPADGVYYVTTFGGGADTQPMACGGTADGTWAYVADSARFGCNTKLLISANGKSCVAEVRDCGPNRCVEEAACACSCGDHFPIIDASPFITKYLLGMSGVGWSDKVKVTAEVVDGATPIGCPGGPVPGTDAGAAGAAGASASGGGAGQSSGGGAGTAGSSGAPASGGSAGATGKTGSTLESDEGCGCRLAGRRSTPPGSLSLLLGLLLLRRRAVTPKHKTR